MIICEDGVESVIVSLEDVYYQSVRHPELSVSQLIVVCYCDKSNHIPNYIPIYTAISVGSMVLCFNPINFSVKLYEVEALTDSPYHVKVKHYSIKLPTCHMVVVA